MILIKVYNHDGTLVGVCDNECHTAFGRESTCVCGGFYRGRKYLADFDLARKDVHVAVLEHLQIAYPNCRVQFSHDIQGRLAFASD